MTEKPSNVPDDALSVGLDPVMASDYSGLFDVMFKGIGGDLIDLGAGTHDTVFDIFAPAINRFAAAKYLDSDEVTGWAWNDADGELQVHVREEIAERFGGDRWSDDPADFGFSGYEISP